MCHVLKKKVVCLEKKLSCWKKSKNIHADASVGIASNINAALYQHMHAFQVQQLSYSHYILGHHNVKVCSCRQAE